MIAVNAISEVIPPLKTSDTGLKALSWMEELKVSHLPIVNNTSFLGLITETDILDLNTPEDALGNHELSLEKPFVHDSQHLFDVINVISELNLSLIPVLDQENNYLGVITLSDLVKNLSKISAIHDPGAIITLELNVNDYSLSEISQIVESNNARILSAHVNTHVDTTKMEVTLKINKTEIAGVLQAFNRYNYNVTASYQKSEYFEDMKKRYDELMKYLDI